MSPGHHAIVVVLGVILVSLCFGLLKIVDVAVSGALRHERAEVALRPATALAVDERTTDSAADGCVIGAVFEDVPSASAEAIDL